MLAMNLKSCVEKEYQHLRGQALADAPLEAIAGVEDEARALKSSLGVNTIRELANHPWILRAQAATEAADTSLTPSQTAFYTMLAANVQSSLGAAIGGTFSPASLSTGFPVYTQGGAYNYYNQTTMQALDGLLNPANNVILLTFQDQTFSNMYAKMANQGYWSLSASDQAIVNSPAVGQAQQLVWAAAAQDAYPVASTAGWPAFITYTMTTFAPGQPMTTAGLLTAATNMTLSYPNTSQALTTYVNTQGPASAIQLAQSAGMAELSATRANTTSPSAANGGLQTGTSSYYVGYTVPVWANLTAGLANAGNAVSVSMSAAQFTSTSANVSIGSSSYGVDIGFFSVSFSSSSQSYNFSSYTSSSSVVSLTMTYTGCTIFGTTPTVLTTNNASGWYDNTVLQQYIQTWKSTATTGFALPAGTAYPPPSTFGLGMPFGRLKTWVISNPPTVSFTVTDANVAAMSAAFQQGSSVTSISLFGFSTGFQSSGYTVSSYQASGSTVTVTLSATPVPNLPPTQQTAFVLGGVASYPPNNT